MSDKSCNSSLTVNGFKDCCEVTMSSCVAYNGKQLTCIPLVITNYGNPSLNEIIEGIDKKLCNSTIDYSIFNYFCLSPLLITTPKKFVEEVSSILCEILGTQTPHVNVVSLSTLFTNYNNLNAPPIKPCFAALNLLPSNPKLHDLTTALQESVCLLNNKEDMFSKVSATDKNTGYLSEKIVAGSCIKMKVLNLGANEKLEISFDPTCIPPSCIEVDCKDCNGGTTLPVPVPIPTPNPCPTLTYGLSSINCDTNILTFVINGWTPSMGVLNVDVKGDSTIYTSTNGIFTIPILLTWTKFNFNGDGVTFVYQISPSTAICNANQLAGGDAFITTCAGSKKQAWQKVGLTGTLTNQDSVDEADLLFRTGKVSIGGITAPTAGTTPILKAFGSAEITENIYTPNTSLNGVQGVLFKGGNRFLSNYGFANTFVGENSGNTEMNAAYNVALGRLSFYLNKQGSNNSALGMSSLFSNLGGNQNTGAGMYSLYSNTYGSNNTGVGFRSLYSNVNAYNNTALGKESLYYNSYSEYNTAVGCNTFDDFILIPNTGLTALSSSQLTLNTPLFPLPPIGTYVIFAFLNNYSATISGFICEKSYKIISSTVLEVTDPVNQILGTTGTVSGFEIRVEKGYTNSTALGYDAEPTASNQVMLGNAIIQEVRTAGAMFASAFNIVSDERIKTNIQVIAEKTISYKGNKYKINQVEYTSLQSCQEMIGYIAQDVHQYPELRKFTKVNIGYDLVKSLENYRHLAASLDYQTEINYMCDLKMKEFKDICVQKSLLSFGFDEDIQKHTSKFQEVKSNIERLPKLIQSSIDYLNLVDKDKINKEIKEIDLILSTPITEKESEELIKQKQLIIDEVNKINTLEIKLPSNQELLINSKEMFDKYQYVDFDAKVFDAQMVEVDDLLSIDVLSLERLMTNN